jgi:hypothetical protein
MEFEDITEKIIKCTMNVHIVFNVSSLKEGIKRVVN